MRTFTDSPAVRERVPLLIGLCGPSGSGKTFSALRLATGIQRVTGGDIYGIDTEADRMKHYADKFKFRHVPFGAPFGSLDYLEALKHCVSKGAGVIIVDSMSHEHEGPGGLLDFQTQELQRLGGGDNVKMLAWVKPKAHRRALINGLLQLKANFVFCFRAKSVTKPVKNAAGKTEMVPQGFEPIAGPEFVYEMTANMVLLPKSNGVPTWCSEKAGEAMTMKLPEQFKAILGNKQLDESTGQRLAEWAKGGAAPQSSTLDTGRAAARQGGEALKQWWAKLTGPQKKELKAALDSELKPLADAADNPVASDQEDPRPPEVRAEDAKQLANA